MKKYVNVDELLNGIYSDNPQDVMKYIAEFPEADVVKVIRCPECKYWNELLGICQRRQPLHGYGVNDYCSKGERRTDG